MDVSVCGGRKLITNALNLIMLSADSVFMVKLNPSLAFQNEVLNFWKLNQVFLSSVCDYLGSSPNDGYKNSQECCEESLILKSELLDEKDFCFVLSCF